MRWLMIGLLVSLGAMLFAAAGVARHIWLRRAHLHHKQVVSTEPAHNPRQGKIEPGEKTYHKP
jgi:hypothetical protein